MILANKCADALANATPISVGDLHIYFSIPLCIVNLLHAELIQKKTCYLRMLLGKYTM